MRLPDVRARIRHLLEMFQVYERFEMSLSWDERVDRVVTNSPWRAYRRYKLAQRLEAIADDEQLTERRAGNAFIEADRAWRYGGALSDTGLGRFEALRTQGMTRNELMIALSCGILDRNGQVHVNWRKERLLQLLGHLMVLLFIGGYGLFVALIIASPLPLYMKSLGAVVTASVLFGSSYPIVMLGTTPLRIARKVARISRFVTQQTSV